jgi:hypothetical protein
MGNLSIFYEANFKKIKNRREIRHLAEWFDFVNGCGGALSGALPSSTKLSYRGLVRKGATPLYLQRNSRT